MRWLFEGLEQTTEAGWSEVEKSLGNTKKWKDLSVAEVWQARWKMIMKWVFGMGQSMQALFAACAKGCILL